MAVYPLKIAESFSRRYGLGLFQPRLTNPTPAVDYVSSGQVSNAAAEIVIGLASMDVHDVNMVPFLLEHEDYFKEQLIQEFVVNFGMWYFGIKGSPYKLLFELHAADEEFR